MNVPPITIIWYKIQGCNVTDFAGEFGEFTMCPFFSQ